MINLTPTQAAVVTAAQTSFLQGSAGSGKTTALQHRLLRLLEDGEPAYTILILVAEPDHQTDYIDFLHQANVAYADLNVTTYTEMAREMVALFWPLVARAAGFSRPFQPPAFLSYDLAQLLMWRIITPMLAEGAFASLRLRPQQIVSQLLDTLNRAALNALSLDEAIQRQMDTWVGEPDRLLHLADAAKAARQFRNECRENSLLDLSLVVEVFDTQLVQHPEFHRYFSERYRHLIVDNVEEQTPAGQNFVASLMHATETTAVSHDTGGGYKRFMAADPRGAIQFRTRCAYAFDFTQLFTAPAAMTNLANLVQNYLLHTNQPEEAASEAVIGVVNGRYRRDMIANLVPLLKDMIITHGLHPHDFAIVTPYLDGALRYILTQALQQAGLPYFLLRRRSSPREEPRIRAWLTWLALAHPDWGLAPTSYDVAEALTLSIDGLDPARAQLLTNKLYAPEQPRLLPVGDLSDEITTRIGPKIVALVEELREWLIAATANAHLPIDAFLHNLFTDLLAQPRFHPEPDLSGAAVCDWLVQAASRLRRAATAMGLTTPASIGSAFIGGINYGLVTANPPELGDPPDPDGIMISTIYGYLLAGRPVQVQVWLETAATGWWDIPNQPLSNAFVLAQSRSADQPWTTGEDFNIRNELLSNLIRGLSVRCHDGIILVNSDLDRRGIRQDGVLWRALQPVIRKP